MKKIIYLFLLLIPFTVKGITYEWVFSTPKVESYNQINLFYKEGYIFIDSNNKNNETPGESLISYYDKQGNYISSKEFSDFVIMSATTDGDKIYVKAENMSGSISNLIHVLNEDFEIEDTFDITSFPDTASACLSTFCHHSRSNSGTLKIINDKLVEELVIYNLSGVGTSYYVEIEKDFSGYTLYPMDSYSNRNYLSLLKIDGNPTFGDYVGFDNGQYISGYKSTGENPDIIKTANLRKISNDLNIEWNKYYEDYTEFGEMASNNDNLFVVAANKTESSLLIMDKKGNITGTLEKNSIIGNMNANNKELILSTGINRRCLTNESTFTEEDHCKPTAYHTVYKKVYEIFPKTEGEGTIEVDPTSPSGEGVTFKVTPKEGYVLSEVKVTDINGNILTFTDNTFTMPSSDVLIEAVFVLAATNPNTKSFITYLAIILGGAFLITVYLLTQRNKYI